MSWMVSYSTMSFARVGSLVLLIFYYRIASMAHLFRVLL